MDSSGLTAVPAAVDEGDVKGALVAQRGTSKIGLPRGSGTQQGEVT